MFKAQQQKLPAEAFSDKTVPDNIQITYMKIPSISRSSAGIT